MILSYLDFPSQQITVKNTTIDFSFGKKENKTHELRQRNRIWVILIFGAGKLSPSGAEKFFEKAFGKR